ncbi:hypothetical protein pb186bvf_002958 [Paramecium bursaria]
MDSNIPKSNLPYGRYDDQQVTQSYLPPTVQSNNILPTTNYIQRPVQGISQIGAQQLPNYGIQQGQINAQGPIGFGASKISETVIPSTNQQIIKGESRIEYIPYERSVTEYEEVRRQVQVPVQRQITDYYAVQYDIEYIPQVIQEKQIEYVPVERVQERTEYYTVEKQNIIQQPQQYQQQYQQQVVTQTQQPIQQTFQPVQYQQQYIPQPVIQQPIVQQPIVQQPLIQQQYIQSAIPQTTQYNYQEVIKPTQYLQTTNQVSQYYQPQEVQTTIIQPQTQIRQSVVPSQTLPTQVIPQTQYVSQYVEQPQQQTVTTTQYYVNGQQISAEQLAQLQQTQGQIQIQPVQQFQQQGQISQQGQVSQQTYTQTRQVGGQQLSQTVTAPIPQAQSVDLQKTQAYKQQQIQTTTTSNTQLAPGQSAKKRQEKSFLERLFD